MFRCAMRWGREFTIIPYFTSVPELSCGVHSVFMSTSKKARASSPADEEKNELWDKYGRVRCDGLANSLKKDTNKTDYRHVYPVSKSNRGTYSFYAKVHDIQAGKEVIQGSFYTAYAAAVTAALSKTKGMQDQRDAALLSGCLTTEQAEQAAVKEGLTLGRNTSLASGFTNVTIQNTCQSTLRPFNIRTVLFRSMPSSCARAYILGGHAALVIARHYKAMA